MLHRRIGICFVFALILTSASLFAFTAAAKKKGGPPPPPPWSQYAVKFVCGTSQGAPRLVPGRYATAVNLYNADTADVTIHKSLAFAYPPQEQATGEVSDPLEDVMASGTALQVDCEEILSEFVFQNPPPATDHVEGFLVIESDRPLQVQVVYTAAGESGDVSIDVEQIAETKVHPRPFLARVRICHYPPGNPGNRHTITVDASALDAHRAHGDTLGSCPNGGNG